MPVPASPDRHPLNVYLSTTAADGLRAFADAQRVSVSALIEALGRAIAEADADQPPVWLRNAARQASLIDSERRRRGR